MVIEVETILIGFIGGVIGGIIVNIAVYKWRKKEEEKEDKIKYENDLKAKLIAIVGTLEKEVSHGTVDTDKIQNESGIYSDKLTDIISNAPEDFPKNMLKELRELSASLAEIRKFFFSIGPEDTSIFMERCQATIDKAKNIIRKFQ